MSAPPVAPPLWPVKLPVVGVTGEYKAGKSLFLVTIAPLPGATLAYDTEKSLESYEGLGLGFERVDVFKAMLARHPKGYKPVDLFLWWLEAIRLIPPAKYRVIALDVVSEIESGLVDWVSKNAPHFGHTTAQYQKMEGIFWGDVKEYWKSILSDLASRCETFAFSSHLKDKWTKAGPTGKRIPKGKETLMELASLYLMLERKPNQAGQEPDKPAGLVLKSRLVSKRPGSGAGEIDLVPTLPARIPIATPHAIRQYMIDPAGARAAKPEELAPAEVMGDDERLRLQAEIATAQRDTEAYRLEQQGRKEEAERLRQEGQRPAPARQAANPAPIPAPAVPATPPKPAAVHPDTIHPKATAGILSSQVARIVELKAELEGIGLDRPRWLAKLAAYNVDSAYKLTPQQATKLIAELVSDTSKTDLADPTTGDYPARPPEANGVHGKGGTPNGTAVDAGVPNKSRSSVP